MPSIVSENLNLKIGNSMQIGGPPQKWHLKSPLQEGERATLILRWRRFPLTLEALLQAEDGTELTLAADVRTPWEERKLIGSIPPIDQVAWRNANE